METTESKIIQVHTRLAQIAKEREELLRELAALRGLLEEESWQDAPAAWQLPNDMDDWIEWT